MEDIKDKKYQYKNLGKETCGSLTCFKYQIIDTTKPTEELIIWFDDAEYKARKFSFKDATQTMTADITYDAVTIGKPSPVKETPDYENMSEAELQKQLQELMKQYGQ
jgi:DNA/RNA-binding domain of Phe-tRNA-synthetase-like protein